VAPPPFASLAACAAGVSGAVSSLVAEGIPRPKAPHSAEAAREDTQSAWALALARGARDEANRTASLRAQGVLDGFCDRKLIAPDAAAGFWASAPSRFGFGWLEEPGARSAVEALNCSWTTVGSRAFGGRTIRACVGDPAVDHMSRTLASDGTYFGAEPMRELASWNPCPQSAPFVLDIGLNLGSFSLLALQMGCHVIAFEPVLRNIGRVARTLAANPGLAARVHLVKSAVGARRENEVKMRFAPNNSGGSKIDPRLSASEAEVVSQVVVDDLFFAPEEPEGIGGGGGVAAAASGVGANASASRPRRAPWAPTCITNPFTGLPLRPADIGFVKIDAESFDGRALHGLRRSLAAGLAANGGLTLELHPKGEECNSFALADFMEELGFRYLHSNSNGVGGSRWLTGARLRRQLFGALGMLPANAQGHVEAALEGLWLRGDMRARAEAVHPAPLAEGA